MRFPDVSQFVFVKKLLITLLNSSVAIECWQKGVQNECWQAGVQNSSVDRPASETRLIRKSLLRPFYTLSSVRCSSCCCIIRLSLLLITCALAALPLFWTELHNNQIRLPRRIERWSLLDIVLDIIRSRETWKCSLSYYSERQPLIALKSNFNQLEFPRHSNTIVTPKDNLYVDGGYQ